jgi:hypothetical protein
MRPSPNIPTPSRRTVLPWAWALACLTVASTACETTPTAGTAPLEDLVAEHRGVTYWFIFTPSDCRLRTDVTTALSSLHAHTNAVRGILLQPPDSDAEIEAVRLAFGIRFPLVVDREGIWERAVRHRRYGSTLLGLSVNGRLTALAAVETLQSLSTVLDSLVPEN